MTVLWIDDAKVAEIDEAVARARANVVPWEKMRDIVVDDRDKPTTTLLLSERREGSERRPASIAVRFLGGVTAAISFEEQPAGILRHISVGTGRPGQKALVNPRIMAELARLFGFREFPPREGRVWIEEYKPNHYAINAAEIEVEREAMHEGTA